MSVFGYKKRKSKKTYQQDSINRVLKKVSLVKIISDFTYLKETRGGDYIGNCPICKKSTSGRGFRISVKKQVYKCFVSGCAGKYPHRFIMQYFNCSFDVALNYLNDRYVRIPLKETALEKESSKGENLDIPF